MEDDGTHPLFRPSLRHQHDELPQRLRDGGWRVEVHEGEVQ